MLIGDHIDQGARDGHEPRKTLRVEVPRRDVFFVNHDRTQKRPALAVGILAQARQVIANLPVNLCLGRAAFIRDALVADETALRRCGSDGAQSRIEAEAAPPAALVLGQKCEKERRIRPTETAVIGDQILNFLIAVLRRCFWHKILSATDVQLYWPNAGVISSS